ncbi:Hypothetical protein R9X50_00754600 [Acrodontium crateriforme]|uniref:MT-A70-domain-containing protein n=1 Tax=Acrodontium crateriforme TaxID=150365 RepID=A0AAQ3MBZ7_9PEZI|nr:Hypothetical protein R9X50_00754600 [Acrodontium crateriforme]
MTSIPPTPASPVLWQNREQTVTLIDIPQSTSVGQGTDEFPFNHVLLSTEPLKSPYESNEPKADAAKAKLETNSVHEDIHSNYEKLITSSLAEIRSGYQGTWCSPRLFLQERPRAAKKRKLEKTKDEPSELGPNGFDLPSGFLQNIVYPITPNSFMCELTFGNDCHAENTAQNDITFVYNESAHPQTLIMTPLSSLQPFKFHVPPNATFSLSDCSTSRPFHDAGQKFDMIILDPPWPNRSVRRARKTSHSTYETASRTSDIDSLLKNLRLEELMADECMVGIWITNKPAIRELVLGPNGLFAKTWELDLVEEWIWLKTTMNGGPVSELGALWRKPYEVFLLGRRRQNSQTRDHMATLTSTNAETNIFEPESKPNDESEDNAVKQRVLVSVPDLHSRKPCLKELLQEFMPSDGRVLEIFARHLVAGWSSWGDECVKFNWEGYWQRPGDV